MGIIRETETQQREGTGLEAGRKEMVKGKNSNTNYRARGRDSSALDVQEPQK